jgi:DNA-binding transcriptional LysR family regulator
MGRLADSTLGARFLGINPWVVVASPGYLAQRGVPGEPSELGQHDALVYSTVQGDARWLFTGTDGRLQTTTVRGPLRSNNLSALLSAARGGLGLAALPWYVAHKSVKAGAVVPVLTDWSLPSQEIHAVYPSPRRVPAKVNGFIVWLQGQLGETWWSDSH